MIFKHSEYLLYLNANTGSLAVAADLLETKQSIHIRVHTQTHMYMPAHTHIHTKYVCTYGPPTPSKYLIYVCNYY